MRAAALPPTRRQRTRHDTVGSFGMALAMHALLFGAISYVVRWNTQDPAPVVAELWVGTPTPIEPPPPPPPPPPPKVEPQPEPPKPNADIVTKEEKKEPPPPPPPPKVEEKPPPPPPPKKVEEKPPPPPPPKKVEPKKDDIADLLKKQEQKARAEREAIRQAEADRIAQQMSQEKPLTGAPQSGGGAARDADYRARLVALIKSRIVYAVPDGTSTSVYADVQVELLPTGEVTSIRFLKPSELPEYDAAVERAIRRTDPFPRKPDGTIDRTITIRFRPVEPPS
jgi:colicin import membrane protein